MRLSMFIFIKQKIIFKSQLDYSEIIKKEGNKVKDLVLSYVVLLEHK